ncbi:MAG: hypothetical protein ACRDSN_10900 [Pseudonocardiaceae bacterium]
MSVSVLLVGNGPYLNRGCEAMVRGTAVVLRAAFGDDVRILHACTSTAVPVEQVERRCTGSGPRRCGKGAGV